MVIKFRLLFTFCSFKIIYFSLDEKSKGDILIGLSFIFPHWSRFISNAVLDGNYSEDFENFIHDAEAIVL